MPTKRPPQMLHKLIGLLVLTALLLNACIAKSPTPTAAPTSAPPPTPSAIQLDGNFNPLSTLPLEYDISAPVHETVFHMPPDAQPSPHIFSGRLVLQGTAENGSFEIVRGFPDLDEPLQHIPAFDYQFVQYEDYLIPVLRGRTVADHPYFDYILSPGRIWADAKSPELARASFPFTMTAKGGNATFNGTMTFLFDGQTVSAVWYQVTQETTTRDRGNYWGLLSAEYYAEPPANQAEVIATFQFELDNRFPTKPITQLALDYPGIDVDKFGQGIASAHMTFYGVVVNGINYVGTCMTRFGPYAYCEYMRASSYSTAKSAFVSVALMRLAQKYGIGVADLLIKDYVSQAADSPGDWDTVTFSNALDMATGNFRSNRNMEDEDGPQMNSYFGEMAFEDRINAAFDWPHGTDPGTQWVYRTSDTFILTTALQHYLQSQEGPDADIYDFVVNEVYKPLAMNPGVYTTKRTEENNWEGYPEGGYGQWWVPDDMAKITTFLNIDHGILNGEQILHPDLLRDALQQNPDDRGLEINATMKYNNAFWAYTTTSFGCDLWIPDMRGISGNMVVLFPNGISYYYFSDNREFYYLGALKEVDKITPFCAEAGE